MCVVGAKRVAARKAPLFDLDRLKEMQQQLKGRAAQTLILIASQT